MHAVKRRLLAFGSCAVAASLLHPSAAAAQGADQEHESGLIPTMALGASAFIVDIWEDRGRSMGVLARVGLRFPHLDAAAVAEHWGDVRGFRISSVHLEGSYFLAGPRTVTPYVVVGVGRVWGRYHGRSPRAEEPDGLSAAYGFGLHVARRRALGARAEALIRTDDGGYNGGVRVLVGWAPAAADLPVDASGVRTDVGAYWMIPLSGPWRFVEPGYMIRFERPFHGRLSTSLALAVFHWQTPGQALFRDYIWDTRALAAMPGVQWRPDVNSILTVRAGPSIIMMGEGPGNGANLGAHLETAITRPWNLPLSAGVGWIWMPADSGGDTRVSDADQNGLMLFGGLHF